MRLEIYRRQSGGFVVTHAGRPTPTLSLTFVCAADDVPDELLSGRLKTELDRHGYAVVTGADLPLVSRYVPEHRRSDRHPRLLAPGGRPEPRRVLH